MYAIRAVKFFWVLYFNATFPSSLGRHNSLYFSLISVWRNYVLIKAIPFACRVPSRTHIAAIRRPVAVMDPLSRADSPQLAWYDYIREFQVYTALERPTEVEFAATGHQVTICHISKAENKLQPFHRRPLEDSSLTLISMDNWNTRFQAQSCKQNYS